MRSSCLPFSRPGWRLKIPTIWQRSIFLTAGFPGSKVFRADVTGGTDGQGRDMISAMIYGLRTSLGVGLLSGACHVVARPSVFCRVPGGWLDALISVGGSDARFPAILVALILLAILGQVWDKWCLPGHRPVAFYARTVRAPPGGAQQGIRGAARCLALATAGSLQTPPAELPAADHRHRGRQGGERHLRRGDPELPRAGRSHTKPSLGC